MSFDVFFVALESSKPTAALHAQVEEAVRSVGGRLLQRAVIGQTWEDIEAEGGSIFEWYGPDPKRDGATEQGGGMAALRGLNLSICRCLYAIAVKTHWVIVAAMEDSRTIRAKESRELPLHDGMPELMLIDGPEELFTFLGGGHAAWKAYRDQIASDRS
jgi:hypothetical protein